MYRLFQHIGLLEEKIAALESWKLRRSMDCSQRGVHVSDGRVNDDIEHLEERLRRAEAELTNIDHSQRSAELRENRKVNVIC